MPQPASPAPVGLPGALSRRTDGGPADRQPVRSVSGLPYGEGQQFEQIQAGAPMERDPSPKPQAVGLFAPTQRPGEPVTSGIDSGPGVGSAAVQPQQTDTQSRDMQMIQKYLPALRRVAASEDAPLAFRSFVKSLETFNG